MTLEEDPTPADPTWLLGTNLEHRVVDGRHVFRLDGNLCLRWSDEHERVGLLWLGKGKKTFFIGRKFASTRGNVRRFAAIFGLRLTEVGAATVSPEDNRGGEMR